MTVFWGLMIPLAGTTLGSACVFFLKDKLNELLQKGLLGFASGVMVAASVWSLLIPSMDMAAGMGRLAFVPAAAGHAFGHGVFTGDGPRYSASAPWYTGSGGTKNLPEKDDDACPCGDTA